ncbi:MAG: tetratricopeptide repeat protein [Myxococcota bacterium]
MAVDRTKVLAAAQKHLSRGNYDRAIAEYKKLVDADARDVRTWLKIGDLYTRKGAHREASQTYQRVAEHYASQGFFLKAVAVYKQILKLQPARLDISLRLAEMYENLQLVSDALSTYESVAAAYARDGDIDRALDTLGRMAALDPENIPIRIKYAEALSKAGRTEDAAEEFESGASLLREQGRIDDYLKVAERLLYHRPDDSALARQLAELYLERSDAKRALAKLQLCFKKEPKNLETLELLARAFHVLGQTPKTISVYREVARIHQEAGRGDERARVLKKILELDPNDAEARQALAGYAPSTARKAPSAKVDSLPPGALVAPIDDEPDLEVIEEDDDDDILIVDEDVDLDDDDLEIVSEDGLAIEEDVPESSRTSIPPDVAREAQIARLLTECDVFARYGLKAKVIAQLEQVVELAPEHVEARERLKDAYLDAGREADAAAQLQALGELLGDQSQVAALYKRQAADLLGVPEPSAALPLDDEPAIEVDLEDPLLIDDPLDDDDDLLVISEEVDELILDGEGDEGELSEDTVFIQAPPMGDDAMDDEEILFVDDDTGPSIELPTEDEGPKTDPPPADIPAADLAGLDEQISPEAFEAAPVAESGDHIEEAEARLSIPPGEIEETLDEADFFLAQGLHDAARATIADALESHPGHPLLQDKLAEIDEAAVIASSQLPPPPPPDEDDAFALAEKLAEELGEEDVADLPGSDVLDVDSVFEQFKKGVQEQIGLEDTDTHFDLGIAYKEMGLLDDAISEFTLAMKNRQRECICQTMIGLCRVEQGRLTDAIGHFKKGLYAESKSDREELGLYFELGRAYQMLDDPKEALYYYQKVAKREPAFREVERFIKELTQPQSIVAPPEPLVLDDVDSAFDELLDD